MESLNEKANESLPHIIKSQLFERESSIFSESKDPMSLYDQNIISNLLNNATLSKDQKELISASILTGNYKKVSNNGNIDSKKFKKQNNKKEFTKDLYIHRHELKKSKFLEVCASSPEIPTLSPKKVYNDKINFLRSMSPEDKRPKATNFYSKKAIDNSQQIRQFQVNQIKNEKLKFISKAKQDGLMNKRKIWQIKQLQNLELQKKIEIKKKLSDFRKKLNDYLVSQKHPLTGSIMRCVDESMIFHFMEKYKGFSMSVEAILAIIGSSIGSSIINPDISTYDKETLNRDFENELKNNYSTSEQRFSGIPSQDLIFDDSLLTLKPNSEPNEEVKNIKPRRYSFDKRPISSEQTFGSGFRVSKETKSSISKERKGGFLNSRGEMIFKSKPYNPYESFRKAQQSSLNKYASDNLRETALAMGFDLSDEARDPDDDISNVSIQSSNLSFATKLAISAMHDQLIEENILPSIQPERVLSDEQILKLGLHERSFDDIMKEISSDQISERNYKEAQDNLIRVLNTKDLNSNEQDFSIVKDKKYKLDVEAKALPLFGSVINKKDQERFSKNSQKEIEMAEQRLTMNHKSRFESIDDNTERSLLDLGSTNPGPYKMPVKPPIAIKTKILSKYNSTTDIIEAPISPFKSFEEKTKVMNTGIPAGSGLMLWRSRDMTSSQGRFRTGTRKEVQLPKPSRPFVSTT